MVLKTKAKKKKKDCFAAIEKSLNEFVILFNFARPETVRSNCYVVKIF
jgi:hypothetical protein